MTSPRSSSHTALRGSRRPRISGAVVGLIALIVVGCGSATPSVSDDARPTVPVLDAETTPSSRPTAPPESDGTVALDDETPEETTPDTTPAATPASQPTSPPVTVMLTEVPDNISLTLTPVFEMRKPIALATRPASSTNDQQVYIADKDGEVLPVDLATGELGEAILDLNGKLSQQREQGLLGLTFSPDGAYMYVDYTDTSGATVIAELQLTTDGAVVEGSEREVLKVDQPAANHNGGDIAFGPDGFLYITLGDGGGGGDPFSTGQDPETLLGSILRIAPRGAEPYAVSSDNPFVDGFGRPEVWLYGVRNPWRISFDRATGDLWIADVGQKNIEEIDVAYAIDGGGRGANLGWSRVEGTNPYNANTPPEADYLAPIYQYTHDEGCSVTGGYVYRGSAIPDLQGVYVFGDFCAGTIWGLATNPDDGFLGRVDLAQLDANSLASFGEGPDGELYVLSHADDTVYRLTASG